MRTICIVHEGSAVRRVIHVTRVARAGVAGGPRAANEEDDQGDDREHGDADHDQQDPREAARAVLGHDDRFETVVQSGLDAETGVGCLIHVGAINTDDRAGHLDVDLVPAEVEVHQVVEETGVFFGCFLTGAGVERDGVVIADVDVPDVICLIEDLILERADHGDRVLLLRGLAVQILDPFRAVQHPLLELIDEVDSRPQAEEAGDLAGDGDGHLAGRRGVFVDREVGVHVEAAAEHERRGCEQCRDEESFHDGLHGRRQVIPP